MLAFEDIIESYGKHLIIFPANTSKFNGASVDLTASKWAWSIKTKKSIVEDDSNIVIHPNDSSIILTNEIIAIDNTLMGILYTKSHFLAKGLTSICGLVDPGFIGRIILMFTNHSDQFVKIKCEDDPITQISFQKLDSTTKKNYAKRSSHLHLLGSMGILIPNDYLSESDNLSTKKFDLLHQELIKSDGYIKIESELNALAVEKTKKIEGTTKYKIRIFFRSAWYLLLLLIVIIIISFSPLHEQVKIFLNPSIAIIGMLISTIKSRK